MEKTAIELFAGVGGFRVGLNHVNSFNKDGKAIEMVISIFFGRTNGNHPPKSSTLLTVTISALLVLQARTAMLISPR